jgi:hypothetical protein
MKTIKLLDFSGEFCTRRNDPFLPQIISELEKNINQNITTTIDRTGVKSFTVSYLDELIVPLILKYPEKKILELILFSPILEAHLLEQIERGQRLRTS